MRWKLPVVALGLILLTSLPGQAGEPRTKPEALYAKAVTAHVERLTALARWATLHGVYAARDEVLTTLLRFDPENVAARRRLRYQKVEGAWVQSPRYKPSRNFKPANLPEYERRRTALEAAFATDVEASFAACRTPAELAWAANIATVWQSARPEDAAPRKALRALQIHRHQLLWGAGRAKELAEIDAALRADYPLDPEIRELLGEVPHGDAYILRETAAARLRRPKLLAAARQALAQCAHPRAADLALADFSLGLTGLSAYESPHLRVVGTRTGEALIAYAAVMEGAGPFFASVLGVDPERRKRTDAYVFAKPEDLEAFLQRFPGIDPALAKQQKQHGLDVFWANGRTLCAGPIQANAQQELCVGVLFMVFLADTWFGTNRLPGWLDEGIARHLAFLMTGTRFGISVGGRYGTQDPAVKRSVPDAHGNWLKAAQKRLRKHTWDLRLLLGKGIDAFTAADSMLAYVLAVYLLEGRPEQAAGFLKRLGSGEDPDLAARRALGMPLTVLAARLRRFLSEMSAA